MTENQKKRLDTFIEAVGKLCYEHGFEIWPSENAMSGNPVYKNGEAETIFIVGSDTASKNGGFFPRTVNQKLLYIDGDN